MRLASFSGLHDADVRAGIVTEQGLIDVREQAPGLPSSVIGILAADAEVRAHLQELEAADVPALPMAEVRLRAPVPRPGKCLGIGMNYADHAREIGMQSPDWPTVFTKQASCVCGPADPVWMPRVSDQLDYEGELVMVIGRGGRHIARADAAAAIGGFCVGNDLSVRDWQLRTGQFTMGKSFDTHGPTGPWLTTADAVDDPHALRIRTWVNDELRQDSSTAELIFDCHALVEHLSAAFTLEPGDLVFTGTPAGVGLGSKPPSFLQVGDRVRVAIDGLGEIDNRVTAEPAPS